LETPQGESDVQRRTLLEAVKELIALREQGDLTEEEFLLAKADLFQGAPEP